MILLNLAQAKTLPGGLVVTLCPNGSKSFRDAAPAQFKKMWGKVHPNFLSDKFFKQIAADRPYYLASTPEGWARISSWDQKSQVVDSDLSGVELLFVWAPN